MASRFEPLPTFAAGGLVLMLALQFALPSRTPLPADSGLAGRRPRPPAVSAIPAYPAIQTAAIFSPIRASDGVGGEPSGPLDDFAAVGAVKVGSAMAALIKPPGGPAQLLRPGQVLGGWRLARIDRDALVFQLAGDSRRLIIGAPPRTTSQTAEAPQGAETPQ